MIFSKKKTFIQKPIQVKYNQINYQIPFHDTFKKRFYNK